MKDELEKKLEDKNIKITAMRLLVLKEITKSKTAVNFQELEQRFDKVERSTLYRTLKIFEEKKLIHPINDGTGSVKFAICQNDCNCKPEELHVHFFCNKCEMTFCYNHIAIPKVQLPDNVIVETANFVLKGICEKCQ